MTRTSRTIAIFSAQYLPHVGGVENYTYNLASEFERKGHHALVICLNNCSKKDHEVDEVGFEIFRLPCHRFIQARYPLPHKNAKYREMMAKIEKHPIDYVIANTRFYLSSLDGVRLAQKNGVVPLVIEHGSDHLTLGNPIADRVIQAAEHGITHSIKKYSPRFYAVSKAGSAWLQHFNLRSDGELHNAIDPETFYTKRSNRSFRHEFFLPKESLLVAFVGRLVPEKGIAALCEAVRPFDKRELCCLVAGDGPLRQQLVNNLPENVRLLGPIKQTDTAALLAQADLFCLPSRSEGFSTSLLEASACHTPSLVTRVGGVEELIPHHSFGNILADSQPETIQAALHHIITQRHLLPLQGERAYERVCELFSWSETATATLIACEKAQTDKAHNALLP